MVLGAEITHRRRPPRRQAVGVQSNPQAFRHPAFVKRRHHALQVALQQAHLLHMGEQTAANVGRARRRGAYQHRLADARFEQFDPLRDR